MDFPSLSEIKRIRERLKWSQTDLANRANVSQSSIPKYESGNQVPSYEVAMRIFKALFEADRDLSFNVSDIMTKNVITIKEKTKVVEVVELMKKEGISQLPVVRGKTIVGTISESGIANLVMSHLGSTSLKEMEVSEIMEEVLPTVPKNCKVREIADLLRRYGAVIVLDKGRLDGIVTKANLLDM